MAYYALEILIAVVLLFAAFLFYRWLVNSPRFTRFIERTQGTPDADIADLEVRVIETKKSARQIANEIRERARREAEAVDRLDKQL